MRSCTRTEDHVGEWRVTFWADTLPGLFAEVARTIARTCGPTHGEPGAWTHVELTAADTAALLVDWANELLGRSEVDACAYDGIRHLVVVDGRLSADIRGRPVPRWRSALKAASYHGLGISRSHDRWKAVILFDV